MNNELTVVNYHYVRDAGSTAWPGIKARGVREFEAQVRWIKENYYLVSQDELLQTLKDREVMPAKAVLLTFDDGYIDHYENVWPILQKLGVWGVFFVPGLAVTENKVMDVNKIQFVVAMVDIDLLYAEVRSWVINCEGKGSFEVYQLKYEQAGRFDEPRVMLIKRLLQFGLSGEIRRQLIDKLFQKYVTKNEEAFSRQLYLSLEQMREMKKQGMFFGNHTYSHRWLSRLSVSEQGEDIIKMDDLLEEWEIAGEMKLMCYPYGDSNQTTRDILRGLNYDAAFTTVGEAADVRPENQYLLPRLDTNQVMARQGVR